MILHHVPDRSGLLIEKAAPLNSEILRHRDLNAVHVIAVPDGFEKGVGKPEQKQVLHRLFAQVMVDPVNVVFFKDRVNGLVERLRGGQIASERFFND